ncbi:probable Purine Transporter AzgA [Pseudozyma flocculosa]|uniref:Probable Purine Transporter AzgA n=1 Tax=Pseudozyma flocculosa TaxID=84751 RepID=A0A5C3FBL4_9BASI|nr:probable Purine Transporter AzgA [Pseudozyma flocculosa]
MTIATVFNNINRAVAVSPVGYYFRLDGSGHPLSRPGSRFLTEIRAGLVTFAAMAYILSVNASILTTSGGPCECPNSPDDPFCANDPAYNACTAQLRRDYVFATGASACIATLLMSLFANMPLGLAPGLGVNAYFAFTIVGTAGSGIIPYSQALAAVWLEGWVFVILSVLGLRQWLARLLPHSLKLSTGAGIGFYLAFIGLGPPGLNVIGGDLTNLVGLGGCPKQYTDPDTGFCTSHVLQDPRVWVGVFLGGIFTALMLLYRVKGAFIIGILLVSIVSWPRNTAITMFPHTEAGDSDFNFFKQVANWNGLGMLGPQNIDWNGYGNGKVWAALVSFLYIDLLDTTGTLYAMASHAGLMDARTGDFEGSSAAYLSDAVSISIGSLLGLSPNTAFVESASGIAEGGRTGITGVVVSFMFFLSLFFSPIFASLPAWATGSTLIIVGSMMASNTAQVNWSYVGDALPAFITIVGIPLFYNIAYGLIAGIISYILLNAIPWALVRITNGRLVPAGWDTVKEPWGARMVSANDDATGFRAILPPWMRKLTEGNWKFWKMTDDEIEFYLEGRRETQRMAEERAEQLEMERAHMYGEDDVEAVASIGSQSMRDEKRLSSPSASAHRSHELPHTHEPADDVVAGPGIGLDEHPLRR